jgi:hypothetical protein
VEVGSLRSLGGSGRIKQCSVANWRAGYISDIALNELRHEETASSCSTREAKNTACRLFIQASKRALVMYVIKD